jgi:cellulose synthase (UDP-forming)
MTNEVKNNYNTTTGQIFATTLPIKKRWQWGYSSKNKILDLPTQSLDKSLEYDHIQNSVFNVISRIKTKYSYININSDIIKISSIYGLFAFLFSSYGMVLFFTGYFWSWLFVLPYLFVAYNFIVNNVTVLFYPNFNYDDHEKFVRSFWIHNKEPLVDVFLPIFGEELDIIQDTWNYLKKVKYKNIQVYVLDDKGDPKLKELALSYKFNYISRPIKGQWKKAGNLQYAYEFSHGKYSLVLDADFRPFEWALRETIPYMETNKEIGILQTPQYFRNTDTIYERSPIEYGSGYVVDSFYKTLLTARNVFDIAFCVGTSAIFRRSAIINSGGTVKVGGSEDVTTTLAFQKHGFKTKYLPLVISQGDNPSTLSQHFKQHQRWCNGSIAITLSSYAKKAKMTLVSKLIYFTSMFYYLGEAFKPFLALHLILLLYFGYENINLSNSIYFIPLLIYILFVERFIHNSKNRPAALTVTGLAQIFTYLTTIIFTVFRIKTSGWVSTGEKVKSVDKGIKYCLALASTFFGINFILLLNFIYHKPETLMNYNFAFVYFLIINFSINLFLYILYLILDIFTIKGWFENNKIIFNNKVYYGLFEFLKYTNLSLFVINLLTLF